MARCHRRMDVPVLSGLSHKNAGRFVAALAHEKSVAVAETAATAAAVRRLEVELKADYDTLVPLVNELKEEMCSAESYLAARDRERISARVHVMRERIDATHSRTQGPHAARLQITQELINLLAFFSQLSARRWISGMRFSSTINCNAGAASLTAAKNNHLLMNRRERQSPSRRAPYSSPQQALVRRPRCVLRFCMRWRRESRNRMRYCPCIQQKGRPAEIGVRMEGAAEGHNPG